MSKKDEALEKLHEDPHFIGTIKEREKATITIEKGQLATLEAIYWNDRKNSSNDDIYENVEEFIIGEIIPRGIEHFTDTLDKEELQEVLLEAYAR